MGTAHRFEDVVVSAVARSMTSSSSTMNAGGLGAHMRYMFYNITMPMDYSTAECSANCPFHFHPFGDRLYGKPAAIFACISFGSRI